MGEMRLFSLLKKNRFQKVIMAFLVTLLIALSSGQVGMLEVSAAEQDGFEYVIENGAAKITNYTGNEKDITIPTTLGGNDVTRIGWNAFREKGLKSVDIPDTVNGIGSAAFMDNLLESVKIPNSVTAIGVSAFENNHISEVTFPDNLPRINQRIFANNYLEE